MDALYEKSLAPLRAVLVLSVVLFGGVFLALDRVVLPDDVFPRVAVVRLIVSAVLLGIAAGSFHPAFRRAWQPAVALAVLVVGTGGAVMALYVPVDSTFVALMPSAFTLFVFAGFTAVRLRPTWGAVLAATLIACFDAIAWRRGLFPTAEWLGHNVMLLSASALGLGVGWLVWRLLERDHAQLTEISYERRRADDLLLSILPAPIAAKLKGGDAAIADYHEEATVLFADICGFTELRAGPRELVAYLNRIFSEFDRLAGSLGIEKIKTIGDGYMAVAGVPEARDDHARASVELALEMRDAVQRLRASLDLPLDVRIGVHCGPVVAGVIGTRKFSFDLWGETVNTASRMESHGLPGQIQVSEELYRRLEADYVWRARGDVELKGLGTRRTYLLTGRRARERPRRTLGEVGDPRRLVGGPRPRTRRPPTPPASAPEGGAPSRPGTPWRA